MSNTYAVPSTTYKNGVQLFARTDEGWPVIDTDGTRHMFANIPAFMAWADTNHGWPMA